MTKHASILLFLTAAVLSGTLAVAQPVPEITSDCLGPSPVRGRIHISFEDTWNSSCVPINETVVIGDGIVSLHATAVGEFCLAVLTPYTITGTAWPLGTRVWATEVVIHRNDGSVAQTFRGPSVCVSCSTADFSRDCLVSVQDVFDFLAAYFVGDPRADVNGVGGVTVQDVFDFLAAYFAV